MSFEMNPRLGPFTLEELDEKAKIANENKGKNKPNDVTDRGSYSFKDSDGVKHQVYSHAQLTCSKHIKGCVIIHNEKFVDDGEVEGVRGNLIPFSNADDGEVATVFTFLVGVIILLIILNKVIN